MPTLVKKPFISVIVTAYNRRKFIRHAVDSVLNSAIPGDEYELIVVKNFRDEYVDDILKKVGGRSILMDSASIGVMVALGINVARGDVITFLDDDDKYLPSRLRIIKEGFESDPSLIYYHNNVITINEADEVIYDKLVEETNIYNAVVAHNRGDKLSAFKRYGWNLGLRSSSMAVKREFIRKWTNIIRRFPDLIDVLIFLLALAEKGTVIHDPRRLTYYRVSSTSTSSVRAVADPNIRFARAVRNAARHALARHMLIALARRLGLDNIRYDEATVIGGIYGNWSKWLSRVVIDLMDCRSVKRAGSAIFGLTYLINPWLAKRLVYLYYTKVFDVLWGSRS